MLCVLCCRVLAVLRAAAVAGFRFAGLADWALLHHLENKQHKSQVCKYRGTPSQVLTLHTNTKQKSNKQNNKPQI